MKTITIFRDEYAENPRHDFDHLGTFYMEHRRYDFGDKDSENIDLDTFDGVYLSVYAYEHGGITLNTAGFSCPWDSGQIGVIYVTREKIMKEFPSWKVLTKSREQKIREYLKNEIEQLDNWLTGNVYAFRVTDENGEIIDSCHGFYGIDWKKNGIADHIPGIEEMTVIYE